MKSHGSKGSHKFNSSLKFPHGTVKHVEYKKESRSVKASCAPLLQNEFGITQTKGKQLGTQYVQRLSYSEEVEEEVYLLRFEGFLCM